jgi:hypothetical protein
MAPKKVGSSSSTSRHLETNPTHSAQMNLNTHKELLELIDVVLPTPSRDRSSNSVSLLLRPKAQPLSHTDNESSAPRIALGEQPEPEALRSISRTRTTASDDSNGKLAPDYEPAQYIDEDEANPELPGTAAYYKSRKFLRKTAAGKIQVTEEVTKDNEDIGASNGKEKPKELVMIFGKTNVRRADLNNKYTARLQRSNKRAKVDPGGDNENQF